VGLVVAGALVGGGIGFAVAPRSTSGNSNVASAASNVVSGASAAPNAAGAGVQPGAGGGGGGGGAGASDAHGGGGGGQKIQGTLTAISASSVTVKSSKGTATYPVTSATEIIRDGVNTTLAQLKVGDPAFLEVRAVGSMKMLALIFAGKA
jgi:hypothetical protein